MAAVALVSLARPEDGGPEGRKAVRHPTSLSSRRLARWVCLPLVALVGVLSPHAALAAPGDIRTVVGDNTGPCPDAPASPSYTGGPARAARFGRDLTGLAVDGAGRRLFIAETTSVHVVDLNAGTIRTIIEAGTASQIRGLAVDPGGRRVYAARSYRDQPGVIVQQYDVTGVPVAPPWELADGTPGGSQSLAVDGSGRVFVRDDRGNGRVTWVNPPAGGEPIEIVSGIGPDRAGGSSIAVDPSGETLYVSDHDGPARPVRRFALPSGRELGAWNDAGGALAADPTSGNLFSARAARGDVVEIVDGAPTRVAGVGRGNGGDGGPAGQAELDNPTAVAVDRARNVFVADAGNCAVRMIETLPGPVGDGTEAGPDGAGGASGTDSLPASGQPGSGAGAGDGAGQGGGEGSTGGAGGDGSQLAGQPGPTADGAPGGGGATDQFDRSWFDNFNFDNFRLDFGNLGSGNLGSGNFDFNFEGMDPSSLGGGIPTADPGGAAGAATQLGGGGGPGAGAAPPGGPPAPGSQAPSPGPSGAGAPGEPTRGAARYTMVRQDDEGTALLLATGAGVVVLVTCLLVLAARSGPTAGRARARPRGAY